MPYNEWFSRKRDNFCTSTAFCFYHILFSIKSKDLTIWLIWHLVGVQNSAYSRDKLKKKARKKFKRRRRIHDHLISLCLENVSYVHADYFFFAPFEAKCNGTQLSSSRVSILISHFVSFLLLFPMNFTFLQLNRFSPTISLLVLLGKWIDAC